MGDDVVCHTMTGVGGPLSPAGDHPIANRSLCGGEGWGEGDTGCPRSALVPAPSSALRAPSPPQWMSIEKVGASSGGEGFVRRRSVVACMVLALFATTARADEPDTYTTIEMRVQGLFQPDRVDAFKKYLATREQFMGDKPLVVLDKVDFDTNVVTLRVDQRTGLKDRTVADRVRWFDETVYYPSRGLYRLKALSEKPREKLQFVEIRVVGLDCLACGLGAYEAVQNLDGVETATASFKTGLVTAWIDPKKTDRAKLEESLKQRGVEIVAAP
jgi:copper chaperone CopZ